MSTGEQPLLEKELFVPLLKTVATYNIENLVETGTGPSSSGMEAAHRLGLRGYSCDVYLPCVQRARELYPDFMFGHCQSLEFFEVALPHVEGPTFFWLDGHCPTSQQVARGAFEHIFPPYDEIVLIKKLKRNYERDVIWLDDIPMIDVPDNPVASHWDVDLAGVRWTGQKDRPWADYVSLLADTHDLEIVGPIARFTPK